VALKHSVAAEKGLGKWITRYAAWLVIPIVFLLYFPSPLLALGFAGALVLCFSRWLATGLPVPRLGANLPLAILLTMVAVGLVIAPALDLALVTTAQVIASVTLFFAVLDQIHSAADLARTAAALVLLGILFALVAPFTASWGPDKLFGLPEFYAQAWPRLPKATNANILAGALAPIVPISLALVFQKEHRWRVLGAVSLAPLMLILVLLQSRGAFFALGVGLAVWATLYRHWFLPLIPLGLLAALVANNMVGGPPPAQFFFGVPGTATGGTTIARQEMWMEAVTLVRESPWVGIGMNAYANLSRYPHVHNLFLQIALDTGIPGLVAFVALLCYAIRSVWNAYSMNIERQLAIGILAAITVLLAHGLGDVIVWGTSKSSIVLWMVLGLAFGLDKIRQTS
jgi:putative inorganic carbon (hco3(-)) transporter